MVITILKEKYGKKWMIWQKIWSIDFYNLNQNLE